MMEWLRLTDCLEIFSQNVMYMDFEICSLINRQKMMDVEILSKNITVSEDE